MVAGDFIEEASLDVDNKKAHNPDGWRIGFPTPTAYRDEWLLTGFAGCLTYPMGKVV
jgi:hypothetical protein